MTTIYDVAERAGVSAATVSRVFNGTRVSPAKQQAVREAAAELGFVPNGNARRLRMGSSQIIAVLIPDIENPFFTALTRGVTDIARAAGYSVMLGNTDESAELEAELVAAAVSDSVAGIIVAPTTDSTDYTLPLTRGVPVVAVDRDAPLVNIDVVIADNVDGARQAMRRLKALGFTRIACISGPAHVMTADRRAVGWALEWQDQHGSPPPDELCRRVAYSIEGGRVATEALLRLPEPPDAILAANNRIAVGTIRHLMSVGRDLTEFGVASLAELPLILFEPPNLVVLPQPARRLGTIAAQLLLERINGSTEPPRTVIVPSEGSETLASSW